jgi:hypothetical protein
VEEQLPVVVDLPKLVGIVEKGGDTPAPFRGIRHHFFDDRPGVRGVFESHARADEAIPRMLVEPFEVEGHEPPPSGKIELT